MILYWNQEMNLLRLNFTILEISQNLSNTNLDCNSRISICDIKKIEMSSRSEQQKSQNIESDLVSIFIYLL